MLGLHDIDQGAGTVTALRLGPEHKSFPPSSWGLTIDEFVQTAPTLGDFQTPLVTLDQRAMVDNVAAFARWARARELQFAPHGKTSMSPQLWQQVLDAGAWGITLATAWQVQLARSKGIQRIMLASELVDTVALRWLSAELQRDPGFEFFCWVDDIATVRAMEQALPAGGPRIKVLVELGGPNGRSGARTLDTALKVAKAVAGSSALVLAGLAGFEGTYASDRSDASIIAVNGLLDSLADAHAKFTEAGYYEVAIPMLTAGGSAYFDLVAERLGDFVQTATVMLRSGAVQFHDDGFYAGLAPKFASGDHQLRSALHGWARVLSRPEPGLAVLDGGKRDFGFDHRLPIAQQWLGASTETSSAALSGSAIDRMNDQHAFLRLDDHVAPSDLPVGTVIRLGLSHPCATFDKWRLIPVMSDSFAAEPKVVGVVETYF